MGNIFCCYNLNRLFLSFILTTFTMTYTFPLPGLPFQAGLNEVAFMMRLEKLIEKLIKLEKSNNVNKMFDIIIDIKNEIETSCHVSLDIDSSIDQIGKKLQKKGYKNPKKELEEIKKQLKKHDKKKKTHAEYIGMMMYEENYQFNIKDEQMLY